jgi:Flp pilus assembly protein TadD
MPSAAQVAADRIGVEAGLQARLGRPAHSTWLRAPRATSRGEGRPLRPTAARDQELDRAGRLIQDGKVDEAVAALRTIVEQQPDNADAHLLLGRALALTPDISAAIAALRRAVELRPTSAQARYTLGTALARFGDLDVARAAFERTIELDPAFAGAHVSLALLFAQRAELAPARTHLARAIELQGTSPAAAYSHYLMAQILRQQDQLETALQHLSAAIERRPDYAEAYVSRGLIKVQLLNEVGAREAFETAVRLSPDDATTRSELGAVYLRDSKAHDAIVHLEHALRVRPAERTTLYNLCRAFQLAGRSGDATQCFEKLSARVDAESGQADLAASEANARGLELEAKGNIAGALEKYQAAVALAPFNPVLRRNVALALCRLGRWEEGIVELQKVLEIAPDDQDAIRALHIAKEKAAKPETREP